MLCGFSFLKKPWVLVFTLATHYIGSQLYVDRWEKKATTKVGLNLDMDPNLSLRTHLSKSTWIQTWPKNQTLQVLHGLNPTSVKCIKGFKVGWGGGRGRVYFYELENNKKIGVNEGSNVTTWWFTFWYAMHTLFGLICELKKSLNFLFKLHKNKPNVWWLCDSRHGLHCQKCHLILVNRFKS